MSTVADFNRIDDCDKIDARCVDAYVEASLDEQDPTLLKVYTSWGDSEIDLTPAMNAAETLTTLYLSPEEDPNCLVYEPERGDNICIHGDDLSQIISMQKLKDVSDLVPMDGGVYQYDGTTQTFVPFDLKTFVSNTNAAIAALQGRVSDAETAASGLQSRVAALETKLTPPSDAPSDVKVVFGNTNVYADTNAVINTSGVATTLDKTHGLYTHVLATDTYGDQIFG